VTEDDYTEKGFARLEGVIDRKAAAAARSWVEQNRGRSELASTRDLHDRSLPGPIKIRRLWSADPKFWCGFLEDSGVLGIVHARIGDPILLIRSAAFMKYPNSGSAVGWHCDEDLWSHPSRSGLTAWIPLTPVPEDSGCLQFIPGSHRAPARPLYWDRSHPYHKVMDVSGLGDPERVPAEVGDCILMDKRCVHASGPNQSTRERIGLVLAFASCEEIAINEPAVLWRAGRWTELEPVS